MKHEDLTQENDFFGKGKISRILLQIAPPVMLAQLIQALYNIVDSLFVGRYSNNALTALSVIYPLQLIIVALAVGTGVGVNTYMARKYAQQKPETADAAAGTGMVLAFGTWAVFAIVSAYIMEPYVRTSATSPTQFPTGASSASAASACFWKTAGRRCIRRREICACR